MEVDDYVKMIVGNLREILDQQFRPRPICLLNIIIILITYYIIQLFYLA
jgi:hypothetical protein